MFILRGLLSKMLLLVAAVAASSLIVSYSFLEFQQSRTLSNEINQIKQRHSQATSTIFENLLLNQILPFTEEIVRLGGVDGNSPQEIERFLRESWPRIRMTFSFQSMSFSHNETQYNFGRFPSQKMLEQANKVQTNFNPQKSIICHQRCELSTTVPILTNQQAWSLSVLTDISPSIDMLSTLIGSEVIVLLPNQMPNPNDKSISRYAAIAEYMTGQEQLSEVFQQLLTDQQIQELDTEGTKIHVSGKDYLLWNETISGLGDELNLIFVRNITATLSQQRDQQKQVIITFATLTIGVSLFLVVFSIFPIAKINQLKRAINLIGKKEYSVAKTRLGAPRKVYFPDELDQLENEFREAVNVLESFEKELNHSQKRLVRQATIDSTTGLFTRNVLIEDLSNLNEEKHVFNVALLFLDLDGFKPVNDNLGHEAGDIMLKKVGFRLKGVINKYIRVYRIGGDEFVICFTNYADYYALRDMADEIVELFIAPFHILDTYVSISASIGVAMQEATDIDPDNLLRYADIAMYQAKKEGKNRYKFFDHTMRENTKRRFTIKNDFDQSLADNQLFVVFQPIIESTSQKVVKLEALSRWNHPILGSIPPLMFIEVIEESEKISGLFDFLIDKVVIEINYLDSINRSDIIISVNISAKQLNDDLYLFILDSKLTAAGIDSNRIELEITETTLISNFEQAKLWIQNAKKMGFKIAIDDFGAGYSSLSYLTMFPYDCVKLDRSLLNNIAEDPKQKRIVGSLTSMLHSLSIPTVAEGAETKQHYDELVTLGCDFIQGYYIAKPIPHEELAEYLKNQSLPEKEASGQ